MATYRAYRVDKHRNVQTGVWLKASSDAEAKARAEDLCEPETPTVEVWRGSRMIDEVECEDED